MKQYVVDTNAFLRFFLNDIPEQVEEVTSLFQQAQKNKTALFVPQIVLFEIAFSLARFYQFPKEKIVESLEVLLSVEYLEIQDNATFKKALEIFKERNLSLADCFVQIVAQEREAELFTFDKALKKLQK